MSTGSRSQDAASTDDTAAHREPRVGSGPTLGQGSLAELARFFLRLGVTAFGGPAAHVAIMEDELVRRRAWVTREKFLDLWGASNLIPGPSSSELAIHIGYLRAGWPGLLIAGTCFIFPAAAIVGALAWAYVRFGGVPVVAWLLYGVKPVVIGVILQALWGLGRAALKTTGLALAGLLSLALSLLGLHPLLLLLVAGIGTAATAALQGHPRRPGVRGVAVAPGALARLKPAALALSAAAGGGSIGLGSLFLVFLKVGAVVFGSGYVLLAFLRADLVAQRGWLTDAQLVDAVAVGQVTPGPVFTTATFIGYVLAGWPGAIVATVGIFTPAFVLVAASGPIVASVRRSPVAGAFLDGVNVASLALMAVVTWQLGRASVVDAVTVVLTLGALVGLVRWRLNSVWLLVVGAVVGLAFRALATR